MFPSQAGRLLQGFLRTLFESIHAVTAGNPFGCTEASYHPDVDRDDRLLNWFSVELVTSDSSLSEGLNSGSTAVTSV
jgi:hypothetical protein